MKGTAGLIKWSAALAASVMVLGACGSIRQTATPSLAADDSVAIASIANFTETPAAGSSAAALAANTLRANGLKDVRVAPADKNESALFDTAQREDAQKKLAWARGQHVKYLLTGAVEEWRYKVGVDGEPVAGVTFELVDVASGQTVWSATGTKSGWSRSSLASVASSLIGGLLAPLHPHA
ncbi:penicillin-binding protein activator LpoB [Paraburkholderia phosphatilytica]|uniref:penicillin-binding protein activator LpoB n=1 Tax=Paraburkholderia phosphatilytica TaxID=2282883 RepID=UPI000E4A18EF|nr:penicillin-binding protein activator LpoB [Paraburkholderia phosphatilytica]